MAFDKDAALPKLEQVQKFMDAYNRGYLKTPISVEMIDGDEWCLEIGTEFHVFWDEINKRFNVGRVVNYIEPDAGPQQDYEAIASLPYAEWVACRVMQEIVRDSFTLLNSEVKDV